MAQRRAAHWPWCGLAQGDSRARRAAADSSLVWERISSQKSGAPSWHVAVPKLQEQLPVARIPVAAPQAASSLPERAPEPFLELQEHLQEAGRQVWVQQQRAPQPVLPERAALQREQQASQQSLQVLEQVSAQRVRPEQARQAPPQEAARTQQERGERQQREEVVAEGLPRQASGELPWRLHLSRPFRPRLFARPRLPLQQRRGSACALFRLRRRRSNSNAFFSR